MYFREREEILLMDPFPRMHMSYIEFFHSIYFKKKSEEISVLILIQAISHQSDA